LLDRLGPRVDRRPEPRLGTALAGAGVVLVVFGGLLIGADNIGGGSGGSGSQVPGAAISLAIVLAGYWLSFRFRTGALGAAAVAATVVALPVFLGFALYDSGNVPPLPFDQILLVSTLLWLVSYAAGPARGHNLYLGAGLIGLWLWLLEISEHLLSFPFRALDSLSSLSILPSNPFGTSPFSGSPFGTSPFGVGDTPDAHTIAAISLVLAVVSLLAAVLLDRGNRRGMATPLMFVGLIQLAVGVILYGDRLEQVGEGFAALLLGLGVVWMGAVAGRRLTTWVGAASVWLGIVLLVDEVLGDSATGEGVGVIIAGLAIVVAAHILSTSWQEPDETVQGPSTFRYSWGSVQPSGPPPPPAGSVLG
jgi:hypothetical protein